MRTSRRNLLAAMAQLEIDERDPGPDVHNDIQMVYIVGDTTPAVAGGFQETPIRNRCYSRNNPGAVVGARSGISLTPVTRPIRVVKLINNGGVSRGIWEIGALDLNVSAVVAVDFETGGTTDTIIQSGSVVAVPAAFLFLEAMGGLSGGGFQDWNPPMDVPIGDILLVVNNPVNALADFSVVWEEIL